MPATSSRAHQLLAHYIAACDVIVARGDYDAFEAREERRTLRHYRQFADMIPSEVLRYVGPNDAGPRLDALAVKAERYRADVKVAA